MDKNDLPKTLSRLAALPAAYRLAGKAIPYFWALTVAAGAAGLYAAFFLALPDARQGEIFRIIFLHVPASWMSLFIYLCMAFLAALALFFNARASSILLSALAPTGALFTFLSLSTGALWGKPIWGSWWVWWDARLVSELILFFMYIGFIALASAIEDPKRADKASALLALVGVANIPIVYFSVRWWHTLHQGYSITLTRPPTVAAVTFWGILLCVLACMAYTAAVALMRFRNIVLERERDAEWVRETLAVGS
ncbi:MAG: heme ABC transporter permease CcmC [Candidatus Accumulibacter sp.]|jgi:heme exporter protein C|nr:heme ABC transporter permease CcmC [Accumulibacter sp.]